MFRRNFLRTAIASVLGLSATQEQAVDPKTAAGFMVKGKELVGTAVTLSKWREKNLLDLRKRMNVFDYLTEEYLKDHKIDPKHLYVELLLIEEKPRA